MSKKRDFHYQQFYWSQYHLVRQLQTQGEYALALKQLATLIFMSEKKLKDKFKDKAWQILQVLNTISKGDLPEIKKINDPFIKQIYTEKLLRAYSSAILLSFLNEVSDAMDQLGYHLPRRRLEIGGEF